MVWKPWHDCVPFVFAVFFIILTCCCHPAKAAKLSRTSLEEDRPASLLIRPSSSRLLDTLQTLLQPGTFVLSVSLTVDPLRLLTNIMCLSGAHLHQTVTRVDCRSRVSASGRPAGGRRKWLLRPWWGPWLSLRRPEPQRAVHPVRSVCLHLMVHN